MENSYNFAKDIIENRCRQQRLAETYEMVAKGYTFETPVLLYAS